MDPLWSQWTLSSAEGCHETTSFQSPKKRKISFHSCKSNFSGSSSSIGNDVMLCISQLGLKTYEIVFYVPNISRDCFLKNWSLVSEIHLLTVRNSLKFENCRSRICKFVDITRTIYWKSERSVQFLKQNSFLTWPWRFLRPNWKK